MKFGYARVSTISQNLDTQIEALKKEGCDKIIQEKKSAKDLDRPELTKLLSDLRPGDTLIVYDLSRLSRSISDTINLVEDFNSRNITLISLKDGYDASNIFSKYIIIMLSMVNDIQRTFQREKTIEGIELAKANGRIGGRRPIPYDKKKMIWSLIKDGTSYTETAKALDVSRRTVANVVKEFKNKEFEINNEIKAALDDFKIPTKFENLKMSEIRNFDRHNKLNNSNINKSNHKELSKEQLSIYDILEENKEIVDELDDSEDFDCYEDDYE